MKRVILIVFAFICCKGFVVDSKKLISATRYLDRCIELKVSQKLDGKDVLSTVYVNYPSKRALEDDMVLLQSEITRVESGWKRGK